MRRPSHRITDGLVSDATLTPVPTSPWGPIQVVSDDLLFVTALRIDAEGAIDDSSTTADALALLLDTASHAETLADAFDARLSLGDLYGADAVCKRMAAEDDAAADASRERLDRALAESRSVLQRRLYDLAERLEQAFVIGEISEAYRAEFDRPGRRRIAPSRGSRRGT